MNGIEDRLRDAFGAQADSVRPHAGVHAEHARRIRRASVRRMITIPAVAAATAAAVVAAPLTLPAVLDGEQGTLGIGRPPADLVDKSTIVTIPGEVPGGARFQPEALGSDGSVVGRTPDSRVWKAGSKGGALRPLGVRAEGGLSTGPGFTTWIAPGTSELICRTADGHTREIAPQGANPERPVLTDGTVIIGNDVMDQPFIATGCDDVGKLVEGPQGSNGYSKAFAYPTLFAVSPSAKDHGLRMLDVRNARFTDRGLPTGVRPQKLTPIDGGKKKPPLERGGVKTSTGSKGLHMYKAGPEPTWYAAATDRYFAWAVDDRLWIVDRKTWKPAITINREQPMTKEQRAAARLTAGDDVIAYSAAGRSNVYDPRPDTPSKRSYLWDGLVLAAGDWLLWSDGRDYRIGRVR